MSLFSRKSPAPVEKPAAPTLDDRLTAAKDRHASARAFAVSAARGLQGASASLADVRDEAEARITELVAISNDAHEEQDKAAKTAEAIASTLV